MTLYKNIFIVGTIAFVYVMIKIFSNISGKSSEKGTKESEETKEQQTDKWTEEKRVEIIEPETEKNIEKPVQSKLKSAKRKLNDSNRIMKFPRPKSNFFIAFQVNDSGIHQKIKKLQEKVILKNPKLFPALISVPTLHVTLAVTHLASESDIKVVKDKLDAWAEKNIQKYFREPCILSFSGVKTFNNVVAYVDIEQGESYKKIFDLSKNLNDLLSSAGYITDTKSNQPHLTFLKLSRDSNLLRSKRKFNGDFEALKECTDHFGRHKVTHIQLLSMNEPKDEFGYYKCHHQIKVSDDNLSMDHSECCTPIPKPKKE